MSNITWADFVSIRSSTVTYTRHLEEKVAELQALLGQRPAAENEDEDSEIAIARERVRDDLIDTFMGPKGDYLFEAPKSGSAFYHGRFAGLSVLRTVRNLCTELADTADIPSGLSGDALAEAFESDIFDFPTGDRLASLAILPSKAGLKRTIAIAMNHALACTECISQEDLDRQIEHLYERDPEDYSSGDRNSLAFVYALLALGRRHEPGHLVDDVSSTEAQEPALKGASYFRAARAVLDTSNGQDLNSVRTIMALAYYLLSSSMISKAYAYICTGVGIAVNLGLHIVDPPSPTKFSPKELSRRRQVFSVLNMMDTYIASVLGLPKVVRGADPGQLIPITEEEEHNPESSPAEKDPRSRTSWSILGAKVFQIQAGIIQHHFPSDKPASLQDSKYEEGHQAITHREAELQEWHKELPEMSPTTVDPQVLRAQLILRIYYACVRISLYRPFLHHVIRSKRDPDFNYKGYVCGSACIESSMQVVWLIDTFDRHGYLHEAQWFNIYLLALAATALMLFVLGTKAGSTVEESRAAALRAQELLCKLGQRNHSARRCYESLAALPKEFQERRTSAGGAAAVAKAAASGRSPRSQFMMGIGAVEAEGELEVGSD